MARLVVRCPESSWHFTFTVCKNLSHDRLRCVFVRKPTIAVMNINSLVHAGSQLRCSISKQRVPRNHDAGSLPVQ
ncbi:hypothetical protein chiPu_0030081 [Chiloscyllium punctatum]|uniref:Uncharacterized protein n=1 Tax=Chiloscyllium punctatum TaxID=137246 RepID=A0A401TTF1_CHIPU|nr:hypothetical protein [Chiloscyllium punctatum]